LDGWSERTALSGALSGRCEGATDAAAVSMAGGGERIIL
jgi:hypothetical protein